MANNSCASKTRATGDSVWFIAVTEERKHWGAGSSCIYRGHVLLRNVRLPCTVFHFFFWKNRTILELYKNCKNCISITLPTVWMLNIRYSCRILNTRLRIPGAHLIALFLQSSSISLIIALGETLYRVRYILQVVHLRKTGTRKSSTNRELSQVYPGNLQLEEFQVTWSSKYRGYVCHTINKLFCVNWIFNLCDGPLNPWMIG